MFNVIKYSTVMTAMMSRAATANTCMNYIGIVIWIDEACCWPLWQNDYRGLTVYHMSWKNYKPVLKTLNCVCILEWAPVERFDNTPIKPRSLMFIGHRHLRGTDLYHRLCYINLVHINSGRRVKSLLIDLFGKRLAERSCYPIFFIFSMFIYSNQNVEKQN